MSSSLTAKTSPWTVTVKNIVTEVEKSINENGSVVLDDYQAAVESVFQPEMGSGERETIKKDLKQNGLFRLFIQFAQHRHNLVPETNPNKDKFGRLRSIDCDEDWIYERFDSNDGGFKKVASQLCKFTNDFLKNLDSDNPYDNELKQKFIIGEKDSDGIMLIKIQDKKTGEKSGLYYPKLQVQLEPTTNTINEMCYIYPQEMFAQNMVGWFNDANEDYIKLMQSNTEVDFKTHASDMMHKMATTLPARRGSASIMEMCLSAIAVKKGYTLDIPQIEADTDGCVTKCTWDIVAMATPNRGTYREWFKANAFTQLTLASDEPGHHASAPLLLLSSQENHSTTTTAAQTAEDLAQ